MSGLLALLARPEVEADHGLARRALGRLDHRGPDGREFIFDGPLALGHQHHWTTPEEVGEKQPVTADDGRFSILFDGRIDNRDELAAALGVLRSELDGLSDARLVLRAYEQWSISCFERLLGPFAVVIANRQARSLVCARDPLGDRSLFYGGDRALRIVASEEHAVLAHPGLSSDLDEAGMASLYAVRPRPLGRSYFRDVSELPPGHLLQIDATGAQLHCYWQWRPERIELSGDADYADRFRELLSAAVRCRLRTAGSPGVLMSGGLDSTSVACMAASQLGPGSDLATVSWVFDELSSCDERRYMDPVSKRWNTVPLRVQGDDAWPLRDPDSWPHNPSRPSDNPYRILKERAYTAAREHEIQVLLTGGWGDHLYSGASWWLDEQLGTGRWWPATRELMWLAVNGRFRSDPGVRRLGARLSRRNRTRSQPPAWLTHGAAELLDSDSELPPIPEEWRRPEHAGVVCGALAADSAAAEAFHASRHGLELRHPYRDRRLVEYMLAVPADQLWRRGRLKHVLREAMVGLLPDEVRLRTRPTSLAALYQRGLLERERSRLDVLTDDPVGLWRGFVREDALRDELLTVIAEGRDGPAGLVPWYCAFAELWRRRAVRDETRQEAAA
jgi:asparagine synthase (glutamine-hydrolysing)